MVATKNFRVTTGVAAGKVRRKNVSACAFLTVSARVASCASVAYRNPLRSPDCSVTTEETWDAHAPYEWMHTRLMNGGAMVSSTGSEPSRHFERRLVAQGDRKLIESTCRRCGTVIVGSVTETLADDEAKHDEH